MKAPGDTAKQRLGQYLHNARAGWMMPGEEVGEAAGDAGSFSRALCPLVVPPGGP